MRLSYKYKVYRVFYAFFYDRLVKKFGGRVVGVYKDDCLLIDNKYYDYKTYEIFKDEYMKYKARR
jgi:hypothetical protein